MNSKIIDSVWFTPMGDPAIGIVLVKNDHDGFKTYIGHASGGDQRTDELAIASCGAKFPLEAAKTFFNLS